MKLTGTTVIAALAAVAVVRAAPIPMSTIVQSGDNPGPDMSRILQDFKHQQKTNADAFTSRDFVRNNMATVSKLQSMELMNTNGKHFSLKKSKTPERQSNLSKVSFADSFKRLTDTSSLEGTENEIVDIGHAAGKAVDLGKPFLRIFH